MKKYGLIKSLLRWVSFYLSFISYEHPPALKRRLKVKRGFYDYQASQPPQERSTITEITLKGKWLAEAGFTVGSQVTVHTTNGWMLIIVDE